MKTHVVMEHAHGSKHKEDLSEVTMMSKGKRLCSQAQAIVNNVYNYSSGRGPLIRNVGSLWLVIFHCILVESIVVAT